MASSLCIYITASNKIKFVRSHTENWLLTNRILQIINVIGNFVHANQEVKEVLTQWLLTMVYY